jgi:hypothetical protein
MKVTDGGGSKKKKVVRVKRRRPSGPPQGWNYGGPAKHAADTAAETAAYLNKKKKTKYPKKGR